MTHEPNTQGASWEEKIEAFFCTEDEFGYSVDAAASGGDLNSKEFVRELLSPKLASLLSKERAEGERRGREKALEPIHAVLVGFDTQNRPAWELFDLITATLPADSTET